MVKEKRYEALDGVRALSCLGIIAMHVLDNSKYNLNGFVFAFYLLFPFFCFLLEDKRRAWLGFVVSIIMNYVCVNYFNAGRNSIAFSFVYFMVGGMVFLYKDVIKESKLNQAMLLIVMLGLIIACFSVAYKTLIMIMFNVIILAYVAVASDHNILNVWPLKFLGGISFEIYLCHMMIYRVVEKAHLLRMFSNEYVDYLFVYITILGGAIGFAIFGKWLINNMFICIEKRRNN